MPPDYELIPELPIPIRPGHSGIEPRIVTFIDYDEIPARQRRPGSGRRGNHGPARRGR